MPLFPHLGAFESTKIHGTGRDVLGTTRHIDRWEHDLTLLRESGIDQLRYSAPWHRIEHSPGQWDWSWFDQPMKFLERHGMKPILDPLHHTSFPDWLKGGFAHPEFPALYAQFIDRLSARYEWVDRYTVFNEPLPTTLFCSLTGMWYPHQASERSFVAMSLQVGRAICRAITLLQQRNSQVQLVHIDTCEHHRALDRQSEQWVEFANARRFLLHDLILGRVGAGHALYGYLIRHGASADELRWFHDHPAPIHMLGLDYYMHSEMEWYWSRRRKRADISFPCREPRGFAAVAAEYRERFRLPLLLSETNIRGTVTDRLTWLKFMEEQCEQLVAGGADLRGFCWYPSIDSTDWTSCCTTCTNSVDPQGIWWLDRQRWERHPSELSEVYAQLARGKITANQIPAYEFQAPLDRHLQGYLKLMRHWPEWRTVPDAEWVA